jgi:O-antigen/teichoic acid export membrane protein
MLAGNPRDSRSIITRFNVGYGLDYLFGPLFLQFVTAMLALVASIPIYGELRAATTIMAPVTVVFTAVTTTLLAAAAQRTRASLVEWIHKLRTGLLLLVAGYSAIVLGALFAWESHVPATVHHAERFLAPITIGNFVLALDAPLVLKMKALHRQRLLAHARAAQAGVAILAPFAAVEWGLLAGAWTLASSQAFGFALRTLLNMRADRSPVPESSLVVPG